MQRQFRFLQGINSESVDLIYLDSPFNKKKTFTAPIGSSAEGASFKDYFREEDIKDEWVETIKEDHIELHNFLNGVKSISNSKHYLYNYCYLCYMAIRLIEMRRVLKDTGSIYFHCDSTMSHYIKIILDCVFGEKNFRNEIIWGYRTQGISMNWWPRKHDIIFMYIKSLEYVYYPSMERQYYKKAFRHTKMDEKGKYYVDTYIRDVWDHDETKPTISQSHERRGYPTQKPLKLLERIIKSSSKENDVVLDPFCGCATTCIASEKLNRNWIGIDISIKAYDLVRERLTEEVEGKFDFQDKNDNGIKVHFSTDSPKRTDKNGDDRLKKYVYIISHPKYPGEFKVGIAKDCDARLNSYQTSDPDRTYKLECRHLTHNFREIEKYIHAKLDNKHEWIKARLEDIKKEIKNYKHKE